MGLELRTRIEAALGVATPAALGWSYPTVKRDHAPTWLDEARVVHAGESGGPDTGGVDGRVQISSSMPSASATVARPRVCLPAHWRWPFR